jgi:hypothetical protein
MTQWTADQTTYDDEDTVDQNEDDVQSEDTDDETVGQTDDSVAEWQNEVALSPVDVDEQYHESGVHYLYSDGRLYTREDNGLTPMRDGIYVFRVENGYVYLWEWGAAADADFRAVLKNATYDENEPGIITVFEAKPSHAELSPPAVDVAALEATYDEWRTEAGTIKRAKQACADSVADLSSLVRAADAKQTIQFQATSAMVHFGSPSDERVRDFFERFGAAGRVRFTRNRTRPNVFSIEDVQLASEAPAQEFTGYTGTGRGEAIVRVREELRRIAQDRALYPYPDGDRIEVIVGAVAAESTTAPAKSADIFGWANQPAEAVVDIAGANRISREALRQLCVSADSTQTIDFMATSKYLFLGDQSDELRQHFTLAAEWGALRFRRNRTSANEFTFEPVAPGNIPDGFPTRFTGHGGNDAYLFAVAALQSMIMDPGTYPYRDAQRVRIRVANT